MFMLQMRRKPTLGVSDMFSFNDVLFLGGVGCISYACYQLDPLFAYFVIGGVLVVVSLARTIAAGKSRK